MFISGWVSVGLNRQGVDPGSKGTTTATGKLIHNRGTSILVTRAAYRLHVCTSLTARICLGDTSKQKLASSNRTCDL